MSRIPEMIGGRRLEHDIPTEGDLQLEPGKGIKARGQTALMTLLSGATSLLALKSEAITCADNHTLLVSGTAAANQTVITSNVLLIDPAGSGRNITLPAEASSTGLFLLIFNTADGAEALTIKDDGGTDIIVLDQNQHGIVFCDGTSFIGFMGGET
jgi:hypothetical protein|tara:strand:+ start:182 stop:649 length:468 start_codon:yes stop_codon:yes gene_type:complete